MQNEITIERIQEGFIKGEIFAQINHLHPRWGAKRIDAMTERIFAERKALGWYPVLEAK